MRNNGTHHTITVSHKCWNTELIENANIALAPNWMRLDGELAEGVYQYLGSIKKSLEKITSNAISAYSSQTTAEHTKCRQV
jgi:hypothetical protein